MRSNFDQETFLWAHIPILSAWSLIPHSVLCMYVDITPYRFFSFLNHICSQMRSIGSTLCSRWKCPLMWCVYTMLDVWIVIPKIPKLLFTLNIVICCKVSSFYEYLHYSIILVLCWVRFARSSLLMHWSTIVIFSAPCSYNHAICIQEQGWNVDWSMIWSIFSVAILHTSQSQS